MGPVAKGAVLTKGDTLTTASLLTNIARIKEIAVLRMHSARDDSKNIAFCRFTKPKLRSRASGMHYEEDLRNEPKLLNHSNLKPKT